MINSFYPDFDIDMVLPVKVAMTAIAEDPLWLDRPDCPYPKDLREALWGLWLAFKAATPAKVKTVSAVVALGSADKWTDVSDQLTQLFNDLRDLSEELDDDDKKEKLAYYRTATALFDKIVGLGERALNVKQVSDFQSKVLSVFDQVLTPDQRTRAMEMLSQ